MAAASTSAASAASASTVSATADSVSATSLSAAPFAAAVTLSSAAANGRDDYMTLVRDGLGGTPKWKVALIFGAPVAVAAALFYGYAKSRRRKDRTAGAEVLSRDDAEIETKAENPSESQKTSTVNSQKVGETLTDIFHLLHHSIQRALKTFVRIHGTKTKYESHLRNRAGEVSLRCNFDQRFGQSTIEARQDAGSYRGLFACHR